MAIRRTLIARARALLLGGLSATALACGAPEPSAPGASPPSLVLITLDTTRADRLGPYGFEGASTPHLDAFAEHALVYERAYATSSWTLPSHASLLTGFLPMQHGAQTAAAGPVDHLGYPVRPLADHFETLAERLGAAGFRTGAVVAGPALSRDLGVAQGFEVYLDDLTGPGERLAGKRAEEIADRAIRLVADFGEEPFLLFVNFFDPHAPYRPPPPWDRDLPPEPGPELTRTLVERLNAGPDAEPVAPAAEERRHLDALLAGYDAEIAYMDHHLGRLLAALEESPRADATWIAITADHGESFGEHDFLSHGAHLYEDNVRVPLLVRAPGAAPGRVATPVQNHRLFATFLDAAGLPPAAEVPIRPLDGTDGAIVTEVRRSQSNVRLFGAFFDRDLRAVYDPPEKLIASSTGALELFDLASDGAEARDLAAERPERVEALRERLARIEAAHPPLFDADARAELSPATREALEALGYLDATASPAAGKTPDAEEEEHL